MRQPSAGRHGQVRCHARQGDLSVPERGFQQFRAMLLVPPSARLSQKEDTRFAQSIGSTIT